MSLAGRSAALVRAIVITAILPPVLTALPILIAAPARRLPAIGPVGVRVARMAGIAAAAITIARRIGLLGSPARPVALPRPARPALRTTAAAALIGTAPLRTTRARTLLLIAVPRAAIGVGAPRPLSPSRWAVGSGPGSSALAARLRPLVRPAIARKRDGGRKAQQQRRKASYYRVSCHDALQSQVVWMHNLRCAQPASHGAHLTRRT